MTTRGALDAIRRMIRLHRRHRVCFDAAFTLLCSIVRFVINICVYDYGAAT